MGHGNAIEDPASRVATIPSPTPVRATDDVATTIATVGASVKACGVATASCSFAAGPEVGVIGRATIGRRRLAEGVLPSAPTTELVMRLHARVVSALGALGEALDRPDGAVAIATTQEALDAADVLAREAFVHLARRLRTDAPNRVRSFEREMEIVSQLQRISGIARHLAASQSPRPTFDER